MVKLKVNQVRKHICPTSRGNGYLKVGKEIQFKKLQLIKL